MNLDRETFATRSLLTYVRPATPVDVHPLPCRVCGEAIGIGDRIRVRQWHHERAHEECGWWKRDESIEPTERRRAGTSFAYWEWTCPTCHLDACHVRAPREGDPLVCTRCLPTRPLEVGSLVEVISPFYFLVGLGKRPRRVTVPAYARGRVVLLREALTAVQFEGRAYPPQWVRTLLLNVVREKVEPC